MALLFLSLLKSFSSPASGATLTLRPKAGQDYVECEGAYVNHLQGITTNGADTIFWSFTDKLVKTDTAGRAIKTIGVLNHHGDLTYVNGKVYVAFNDMVSIPPGEFNVLNPNNPARQWIYEYDANTLAEVAKYPVPQLIYGAGGIAHHDGKFLVVGGLPTGHTQNIVHQFNNDFEYLGPLYLPTGYTFRGIQTAEFAHDSWWFGTYHDLNGNSATRQLLRFGEPLTSFTQSSFDAALGLVVLPDGKFLVGKNRRNASDHYVGRVELAALNASGNLAVIPIPVPEPHTVVLAGSAAVISLRARQQTRQRRIFCRH